MTYTFSQLIKSYFASYSGLPKTSWQRIGLTFINTTSVGICFFLSLYFVKVLHFNIAMAGVIISAYGLGTATGGIVGGKLSDKVSPSIISIVSLLIEAGAFLSLSRLKSIDLLMFNVFILGIAAYAFKTSNNVWLLNQSKEQESERLKTINILYAASNLGIGSAGVIVSILERIGFQYIFCFSSALLFLSSAYLIFQEIVYKDSAERNKSMVYVHIPNQPAVTRKKEDKKIVRLILICLFLVGIIITQRSATYLIYLRDAFPQLGIKWIGLLFSLNPILIVLFQAPIINRFTQSNKIAMVGVGACLMGLGMFMLSFSYIFSLAVLSCIIYTAGEMLFFSLAQLICYQRGAALQKGHVLGMFQMTYAVSVVVGPSIGGWVYHHFSGNMVWYLNGIIGILCLVICMFYKQYD
jgi:predicted MFS family arabinose efflux permease